MQKEKYLPPMKQELRELGYIRKFVTYEATNAIIADLTSPTNKLSYIALDYLNQYHSIVNVVRHPIGVLAYGINNLNQFGGNLDNVLYQSSVILYRRLIQHYNLKYPHNQYRRAIPPKSVKSLADTIYTYGYQEASILATELRRKDEPYDSTNSWYKKLIKEQNES